MKRTSTLQQALIDRIKTLRCTQTEIAEATGIAQSTIGRFMRGEASITIRNYEAILNYTRNCELFAENGIMPRRPKSKAKEKEAAAEAA